MANTIAEYFKSVGSGIKSLVMGMGVTGSEFVTHKITEQYPENRDTLPDRRTASGAGNSRSFTTSRDATSASAAVYAK